MWLECCMCISTDQEIKASFILRHPLFTAPGIYLRKYSILLFTITLSSKVLCPLYYNFFNGLEQMMVSSDVIDIQTLYDSKWLRNNNTVCNILNNSHSILIEFDEENVTQQRELLIGEVKGYVFCQCYYDIERLLIW